MKNKSTMLENPQHFNAPLAARMRPQCVEAFIGQRHLLSPGKPLYQALETGKLHSMIFWGPPGSGKTTLAQLLAKKTDAEFYILSAVMSGVKEIRHLVEMAEQHRSNGLKTIIFIDELHRFNKAQQDAFLPYVESGLFILIGATTENPSFEVNRALLSRARLYVLKSLTKEELQQIIQQALADPVNGYGEKKLTLSSEIIELIAEYASGDARQALNLLEQSIESARDQIVDKNVLLSCLTRGPAHFDKGGEEFYNQISALHKSVRGSDPHASLYWFARMLVGGADPIYIARRVVRMASEDIGNADPRALTLALAAYEVQERLGSPEGELAIAQAIIYLACAAKSNAVYTAFKSAMEDAQNNNTQPVPIYLKNLSSDLKKLSTKEKTYRYPHDFSQAYVPNEHYFPTELSAREYYQPTDRGLEAKISEKLKFLRGLDRSEKV